MAAAAVSEGFWTPPGGGRRLFHRLWTGARPRGLLVLVHGFGEHGARYASFADWFTAQGYAVGAADLWGHGRSDGRRGDVGPMAPLIGALMGLARERWLPASGQSRYAVFGHSFGGLAAIHWGLAQPAELTRLVVQSPLLGLAFGLPAWKEAVGSLAGRWWPQMPFDMRLDARGLSHDPEVIAAYGADALVHPTMRAGTYQVILRAKDEALRRAAHLHVPTLLLLGGADPIVSVRAAQEWASGLRAPHEVVIFPGMFHELHHEVVRQEVLDRVKGWIG